MQAQTDVASFAPMEPLADGFRNFYQPGSGRSAAVALVDRVDLLGLTVPEMTVLVGGMCALNANTDASANGVLTSHPGTLTNDFFVNLLDMSTAWSKSKMSEGLYEGRDRASGALKWTATKLDLVFGWNSGLGAVSEVYACADGRDEFVRDFAAAWVSVMNRDLQQGPQAPTRQIREAAPVPPPDRGAGNLVDLGSWSVMAVKTSLEREAEAAKIAAALSKAIAAKLEPKRLQACHIDYVTNSGDHDDAHFVDGIDFRKNPEGKSVHQKS